MGKTHKKLQGINNAVDCPSEGKIQNIEDQKEHQCDLDILLILHDAEVELGRQEYEKNSGTVKRRYGNQIEYRQTDIVNDEQVQKAQD